MENINEIVSLSLNSSITGDVMFSEITVVEKYLRMIAKLSTDTFSAIKIYLEDNTYLHQYLNSYYKHKVYPIHYIFSNHDLSIEMIDYFISYDCKLYYENEYNLILLYLLNNTGLTNNKVLNILEYLKLRDYNFLKNDIYNNNVFHYLSRSIHMNKKIFNLILNINRDYDKLNHNNNTPLLIATRENNTKYCLFLIENGCDVNKVNHNNNTALMYACMHNNGILVTKLLEYGADLHYADNQKDIPFFYACGCDNKDIPNLDLVKFLYMKGADIHKRSHENFSVLHYAAGCLSKRTSIDTIIYLIRIGVNTDLFDVNGKTFIDYLVQYEEDVNNINNLLDLINLTIPLKNSLIINEYDKDKFIKINKIVLKGNVKCNISHTNLEEEDKYYMCEYNHYFDNEYLISWYKESKKYVCPLCFKIIDLSCLYSIS